MAEYPLETLTQALEGKKLSLLDLEEFKRKEKELKILCNEDRDAFTLRNRLIDQAEEIIATRIDQWPLSRRQMFEVFSVFWSTYTLIGGFFSTFISLSSYFSSIYQRNIREISLSCLILLISKNRFNLDLLDFDGVFTTSVVNEAQELKVLRATGLLSPTTKWKPDLIDQVKKNRAGLQDLLDIGVHLEALVPFDQTLTDQKIGVTINNLDFFAKGDLTTLPDKLEKIFQVSPLNGQPFRLPISSNLAVLVDQKTLLETSLGKVSTEKDLQLRSKIDQLDSLIKNREEVRENDVSPLRQILQLLGQVGIRTDLVVSPVDQIRLNIRTIDPIKVKESYLAQIFNRNTTTGKKPILAFQRVDGAQDILSDCSVWLGKFLAESTYDISDKMNSQITKSQILLLILYEEDFDLEQIGKTIGDIDYRIVLTEPIIIEFLQTEIANYLTSLIQTANLPSYLSTRIFKQAFTYIFDRLKGKPDVDTQISDFTNWLDSTKKMILDFTVIIWDKVKAFFYTITRILTIMAYFYFSTPVFILLLLGSLIIQIIVDQIEVEKKTQKIYLRKNSREILSKLDDNRLSRLKTKIDDLNYKISIQRNFSEKTLGKLLETIKEILLFNITTSTHETKTLLFNSLQLFLTRIESLSVDPSIPVSIKTIISDILNNNLTTNDFESYLNYFQSLNISNNDKSIDKNYPIKKYDIINFSGEKSKGIIKAFKTLFKNSQLVKLYTRGDGSCFVHSLLQALYPAYVKLTSEDQEKLAIEIRIQLAKKFTLKNFLATTGKLTLESNMVELEAEQNELSEKIRGREKEDKKNKKNKKKPLTKQEKEKLEKEREDEDADFYIKQLSILYSTESLDDVPMNFIYNQFNVNIYFLRNSSFNSSATYIKNYNTQSIIILYNTSDQGKSGHYSTVGLVEDKDDPSSVRTLFSNDHPFIVFLDKYYVPNTE